MSIFSSSKTVVGVFDNESDAGRAVDELFKHGFGTEDSDDNVEVMDQHRFAETPTEESEEVLAQPATGSSSPAGAPVVVNPGGDSGSVNQVVERELTNMGVDEEEATYFARQVTRGGVLVVVETSEERAGKALDIMNQTSTQGSASQRP